jgi:hypothetical protein
MDQVVHRSPQAGHWLAFVGARYVTVTEVKSRITTGLASDVLPVVRKNLVEPTLIKVTHYQANRLWALRLLTLHHPPHDISCHFDISPGWYVHNRQEHLTKLTRQVEWPQGYCEEFNIWGTKLFFCDHISTLTIVHKHTHPTPFFLPPRW